MYFIFSVLIIIACVLLILIVLVQNSKGGGLAANFSSSNQVMGVRKTADFLEKATWTLAICVLAFSLLSSFTLDRGGKNNQRSAIEDRIPEMTDPSQLMQFPTSVPEQPQENATENESGENNPE